MHRTGVFSAESTEDLNTDLISVPNQKDLGRNEPPLAFQRDIHFLVVMKLYTMFYDKISQNIGCTSRRLFFVGVITTR